MIKPSPHDEAIAEALEKVNADGFALWSPGFCAAFRAQLGARGYEIVTVTSPADLKLAEDCELSGPRRIAAVDAIEEGEWRCFHCDEVLRTKEAAREHFGADEIAKTACQIDIAEYRRLEDQQTACRAECCEEAKRYWANEDDRRRALIAEEQKGYDKGLADSRKEFAGERERTLGWSSIEDTEAVIHVAYTNGRNEALREAAEIARGFCEPNRFIPSESWRDDQTVAEVYDTAAIDVSSWIADTILARIHNAPEQTVPGRQEQKA